MPNCTVGLLIAKRNAGDNYAMFIIKKPADGIVDGPSLTSDTTWAARNVEGVAYITWANIDTTYDYSGIVIYRPL